MRDDGIWVNTKGLFKSTLVNKTAGVLGTKEQLLVSQQYTRQ